MIQFFVEDVDFDTNTLSSVPTWLSSIVQSYQQSILEINYIFCSDEYLLSINQEYLSHDFYTDIITFDNRDDTTQAIESDIIISIDRVPENAARLDTPFLSALLRVLVHGLLHILGFSDHSDEEKNEMRSLENRYLELYFNLFHTL